MATMDGSGEVPPTCTCTVHMGGCPVHDAADDLLALLDSALDDLPRYMCVSQPENGWLPGEPGRPLMRACVYVDDVREMLRRNVRGDA